MKKSMQLINENAMQVNSTFFSLFIFAGIILFNVNCKGKPVVKNFQTTTESQWNGQTITGTVRNLSADKISFISVEYDMVDDRYMVLQTVSASSNDGIEPNGKWDFEIPASVVGARSARLKNTVAK